MAKKNGNFHAFGRWGEWEGWGETFLQASPYFLPSVMLHVPP